VVSLVAPNASERLYTMLGSTGDIRSVAMHVPSNRDVRGHMKRAQSNSLSL
jgi:hypothetical protein